MRAVIDAHHHFWRPARGDYGWLTPALAPIYRDCEEGELAPTLARHGIGATILVQAAASEAETDYLLALARRAGFVSGVVGWLDFERSDAAARVAERARDRLVKGFRPMLQDLADPAWMLEPFMSAPLRMITNLGLRFDALVKPQHLVPLTELVARHPDLPVVIDHGAKPDIARWSPDGPEFAAWRAGLARLAGLGCYCKLSGLATEARPGWTDDDLRPYVDVLVELYGAGRLMWGSDWPVVDLAGGYDRWQEAALALIGDLDPATQAGILGGTAAEFYGLAGSD